MIDPELVADDARRNWSTALRTYRTALVAYQRLLEIREQRRGVPTPMEAIETVLVVPPAAVADAGWTQGLTMREREVAELIARGYSNRQIADALVLTRGTVANHVAHVLAKVGASNRTQVAALVLKTHS